MLNVELLFEEKKQISSTIFLNNQILEKKRNVIFSNNFPQKQFSKFGPLLKMIKPLCSGNNQ